MFCKSFVQTVAVTTMLVGAASAAFNNTVYVVMNAETPSLNLPGLTPIGEQRASLCMPEIFESRDVGLVITCSFDSDSGLCSETEATATPTAAALGLPLDLSCGAGEEADDDCISDLMHKFGKLSTQSILVVWDLNGMDDLFENLGVDDDFVGPFGEDDNEGGGDQTPHFDIIFTIVKSKVKDLESMNCTGIDGPAPESLPRRFLSDPIQKRALGSRITRNIGGQ